MARVKTVSKIAAVIGAAALTTYIVNAAHEMHHYLKLKTEAEMYRSFAEGHEKTRKLELLTEARYLESLTCLDRAYFGPFGPSQVVTFASTAEEMKKEGVRSKYHDVLGAQKCNGKTCPPPVIVRSAENFLR